MKALLVLVALVGIFISVATSTTSSHYVIELLVFSGSQNPIFGLTAEQTAQLQQLLTVHGVLNEMPTFQGLGYNGFHLVWMNEKQQNMHGFVHNDLIVEQFLLEAMLRNVPEFAQDAVVAHVKEQLFYSLPEAIKRQTGVMYPLPIPENVYIRGPDNVTAFDPSKWNSNSQVQYNNNCYNYGNDIRTDTFAQPGRGTGQKWKLNTCEDVTAAAVRDGLINLDYVPTTEQQPKLGHFVALVMWPNVNFHWYKKDISTNWSHKPGSTPARDTDNSGKIIPDPRYANRGPYTQFCGFMISVPSNVTIN